MTRKATNLLLALVLLSATGCKSGLTIGPWTLIESSLPLNAGKIDVTRTFSGSAQPTEHDSVTSGLLVVDLRSGRASLTDQSGQAYPLQLDADTAAALRRSISDRSWKVSRGRLKPRKDATGGRVYEMLVYVDGEPLPKSCTWHVPSRKPLPDTLNNVMEIFDQAVRRVHPLSRTINLIE
ncbi:MAG: hypothetical protein QGG89_14075 [Vicinamibacterales bacterium]|nr:hypothetical protein [Vicinamibacterales bacterium]